MIQNDAECGFVVWETDQVRPIGAAITLMALWLLMSGLYKTLIIGFGVLSVLLVVWLARRMDSIDDDGIEFALNPFRFIAYFGWLLIEIAKANWTVTKTILSPSMPIMQNLFRIPYSQRTDLAQVIFANSITLTPGTITVETEPGDFLVHAVSYTDGDPDALAEMDRRVTAAEGGNKA